MTREDVIDKLKEFVEDALYYNTDCDYVGCMPIELVQSAIEFLQERPTEKEEDKEQPSKSCSYYAENGKKPCCTHDCDGCTWYV